jgi:PilZ domain-containing protein
VSLSTFHTIVRPSRLDQRQSKRFSVRRRCRVRRADSPSSGWRSMILNFSVDGIGVTLPAPLRLGAILEVMADEHAETAVVRVRVVHVRPLAQLWLCGCALESPIRDPEVRTWLSGSLPRS